MRTPQSLSGTSIAEFVRMHPILLLALTLGIAALAGPQTDPSPANSKTLTLTGCVQPDDRAKDTFKLSVKETGTTYRLSGASVKGFVWRNVRIVGGLVPTPNLAAQAGAIDQTKVAMAQQGANPQGGGNAVLLEFRVTTVRPAPGSCSPTTP
jgi:hypothetical protein